MHNRRDLSYNQCITSLIKYVKGLIYLSFLGVISSIYSQESHSAENLEMNKELGFEVVTSGIGIYTSQSNRTDFATEIHLTYWITHRWALGVGYTTIFEENDETGHDLALLFSIKPWSFMTLNLGPSVSFPTSEYNFRFSGYIETEFNFFLGKKGLHTGPVIGTLIGEELRYFGGLHLGLEF